ncbi:hypothetical protein QYM36_009502 [Artemia franciscana]|uniref:Uncharacterized protein n=1 Tax=Artemia franciscana TaxID=6661 RepID=A0AA88HT81_ARTSF|nr:hypothetical protein QYM36_009502 [Artemia franciscana]
MSSNAVSMSVQDIKDSTTEFATDPGTWAEQDDYIHAAGTVLSKSVVNDHAKRVMALAQKLIGNITKDESRL